MKQPTTSKTPTRRQFLKTAVAGPLIVKASVLGRGVEAAPSERVTIACIGTGGQGTSNMRAFLHEPRTQVVAVCDVDKAHRERSKEITGVSAADLYIDYREILARDDIDAVSIGTPDHWHALNVIDAAKAGKDIYCEKPLSLTIDEGRRMSDTVTDAGRVLQTGTWRRSREACRKACEFVRNGRIGELRAIQVRVPEGYAVRGGDFEGPQPDMPVPEGLDYERWLGPAPSAPYTRGRCHFNFRWILDYSSGYITDWGAHYYDVAQWGNGTDHTGPTTIEARATFPDSSWLYDASITHHIEFGFSDGRKIISETTTDGSQYGIKFEGTEGWIYVENMEIKASKPSLIESPLGPNDIRLYESADHHANFIDSVLSREPTAAPVETAHRSATLCHLGHIATRLNRPLQWDPKKEEFENDPEANAMRSRPTRAPWRLG